MHGIPCGALAQLGERLICIQEVIGSIPIGSTNRFCDAKGERHSPPANGSGRSSGRVLHRKSPRADDRIEQTRSSQDRVGSSGG